MFVEELCVLYQLCYSVVSDLLVHIPTINGNIVIAFGLGAIHGRLPVEELRSRADFKTTAEVEQSDVISHATGHMYAYCAYAPPARLSSTTRS